MDSRDKRLEEMLLKKRSVLLRGVIDSRGEVVASLCNQLAFLAAESLDPISMEIDSAGGDIRTSLSLYDVVYDLSGRIETTAVVRGDCSSAASIVLQAFKHRIAYSNSIFLIHGVEADFKVRIFNDPVKKMQQIEATVRGWQETLERIYSNRTNQKVEQIRKIISEGENLNKRLTAAEALSLGFLDKVINTIPL